MGPESRMNRESRTDSGHLQRPYSDVVKPPGGGGASVKNEASRAITTSGYVQPSARSFAYAGLITPAMRASRSSNGRNADFIALTVNHSMSRTL